MNKEDLINFIKNIPFDKIIKFKVVFEDEDEERHYIEFDNEY